MHYFSPIHFPLLWYLCWSKVWNVMAQYLNKYWAVKNLYQCLNKSLMLSLPAFGPKLNWIWLFLCNRNKKLRKSKEIEFYSSLFTFLKKKVFSLFTEMQELVHAVVLAVFRIPSMFWPNPKCFFYKKGFGTKKIHF